MKLRTFLSLLCAVVLPSFAPAQKQAKQNDPFQHPFANPADQPGLPRVLIVGDSISIGYTPRVRKLLNGQANVHRPTTNCRWSAFGNEHIKEWVGDTKWDVIHFNWGLHDLKYIGPKGENLVPKEKGGHQQVPIDEYSKNLETLVQRLKKTGAKLIWRNTTPVPPGSAGRYVGDSVNYNEAAAKVMKKHGVPTHDLYTISKERMKELMLPANVHYTKDGYQVLAKDVARVIEEALK